MKFNKKKIKKITGINRKKNYKEIIIKIRMYNKKNIVEKVYEKIFQIKKIIINELKKKKLLR